MPKRLQRGTRGVPEEVAEIKRELERFLNAADTQGRKPNNAKCGVYVFYDYDGEPIYVGQTAERLRVRIRRHLTNQRTDAVAMNVLDPFEVADVEVYPFYDLEQPKPGETPAEYSARVKATLGAAEYMVFQDVLRNSALGAVLNEADIPEHEAIVLPESFKGRIIPPELYERRKHPDVRIARRASTVANLARVISERDVSRGLRRTLLTQARRLELLARQRLNDIAETYPVEESGEETGETEKG
ncbi:MAG: GIY-YIG nuclease family protein [Chloroflexota bacterium]|nr:GIY-YIG nuclease family protein [Chloroflexota bacterium]